MKTTIVKRAIFKLMLAFAVVFTSSTDTMAAWPEMIDKRAGADPSITFYVFISIVIIIGIIIAIVTSREPKSESK